MATALKGYAYTQNLNIEVFDADYNQILPQIMDSDSEMYAFKPDAVLIYMCAEKLYLAWCDTTQEERLEFANIIFNHIQGGWEYITSNSPATIIQFTFAQNDDLSFGNYACKKQTSFIYS